MATSLALWCTPCTLWPGGRAIPPWRVTAPGDAIQGWWQHSFSGWASCPNPMLCQADYKKPQGHPLNWRVCSSPSFLFRLEFLYTLGSFVRNWLASWKGCLGPATDTLVEILAINGHSLANSLLVVKSSHHTLLMEENPISARALCYETWYFCSRHTWNIDYFSVRFYEYPLEYK